MKDERLHRVFARVRAGARVADIGTDHAHLPVALVQEGRCPSALACDLREGPLQSAKRAVAAAALQGRIDCRLGDGLSPVLPDEVDDIVIAGMGGETIAAILEACHWVRNGHYRLHLQPMTRAEELRRYLFDNGYITESEEAVRDGRHLYAILTARYEGAPVPYREVDTYLGALCGDDRRQMAARESARLQKQLTGATHRQHEADIARLTALLHDLEEESR